MFRLAGLLGLIVATMACAGPRSEPEPAATLTDLERNRALIAAAWADDVDRAQELIALGADVNFKDDTVQSAYLVATSEGHLELLELTLVNGADVHSLDSYRGTGLIRAAERGHEAVVERLLSTDIDVDHINNLGWTALHEAIILGDGTDRYVETVRLLLDAGADPTLATRDGTPPLELAEARDQAAIADLLRAAITG